jgi:DNA polymerase III delta prime subunit
MEKYVRNCRYVLVANSSSKVRGRGEIGRRREGLIRTECDSDFVISAPVLLHMPNQILAPIRSRCLAVRVGAPTHEEVSLKLGALRFDASLREAERIAARIKI